MTDLSLISSDDMLDELARRSDAMIYACYQNRTAEEHWYQRRWCGGNIPCAGLVKFIGRRIASAMDQMDQYEEEPPEVPDG